MFLKRNIDKTLELLEENHDNTVNHVLVWKMNDCNTGDPQFQRDTDLEMVSIYLKSGFHILLDESIVG